LGRVGWGGGGGWWVVCDRGRGKKEGGIGRGGKRDYYRDWKGCTDVGEGGEEGWGGSNLKAEDDLTPKPELGIKTGKKVLWGKKKKRKKRYR